MNTGRHHFILTLHGVGCPPVDGPDAPYWLDADLVGRLFEQVTSRPSVKLTFDDGLESDQSVVLPMLMDHGLKATFFICAGLVDSPGYISADGIRRLVDSGMTIGSHGLNHVSWQGLKEAELQAEIGQARSMLQEMSGADVTEAACPFGRYDRRSLQALKRAGFRTVYTSDGQPATEDQWRRPRYTVTRANFDHVMKMLEHDPVPGTLASIKSWLKGLR